MELAPKYVYYSQKHDRKLTDWLAIESLGIFFKTAKQCMYKYKSLMSKQSSKNTNCKNNNTFQKISSSQILESVNVTQTKEWSQFEVRFYILC
jgi:hypothetical protein